MNYDEKWSFIPDPKKEADWDNIHNCASAQVKSSSELYDDPDFKKFCDDLLLMSKAAQTNTLPEIGVEIESHPLFDKQKCLECYRTDVYTRLYFNPKTHRQFYLCYCCSEDFVKRGFLLLQ
jgi:hypothetical protein